MRSPSPSIMTAVRGSAACGFVINGIAHGPRRGTTVCQLHMRSFKDGDALFLEPWRAKAFPIIKDLIVNRNAFDRIIQSGGFISVSTGGAPEANSLPVSKEDAELSMDAAECIGCGACVAACPNASAMLYTAAKYRTLACSSGAAGALPTSAVDDGQGRAGRLWQLHEHRRVRSCMPQRD